MVSVRSWRWFRGGFAYVGVTGPTWPESRGLEGAFLLLVAHSGRSALYAELQSIGNVRCESRVKSRRKVANNHVAGRENRMSASMVVLRRVSSQLIIAMPRKIK
jgi:hypothetical protein